MTCNTKEPNVSVQYFNRELDERAKLVRETILKHCTPSAQGTLQEIYQAINMVDDDSKLLSQIISGGNTNYSFKVFLDKNPNICVFAKLSFEFALWNPDPSCHYDLKRTENEFNIMAAMSSVVPESIVSPLACWDVEQNGQRMKLLVTEWSSSERQFCYQFFDGCVDPRIAPKLADTLAALHNIKDFDPEFNILVKPCMENLLENMRNFVIETIQNENPSDRTEAYLIEMGTEVMKRIINASISNYHKRDCLIHSDSHVFNILVETKPSSITNIELFGSEGTMVLCDWEMSMAGPMGRDVGLALAFPIGCIIAHGLNGHKADSIHKYIISLLDSYCTNMIQAGMTTDEIKALYRNIVGWCGWFQFVGIYWGKLQLSFFPVQNEEQKTYVRDATGLLGMKLMRFSYDIDYIPLSTSLDKLKSIFDDLWKEEVSRAYTQFPAMKRKSKHIMQPRKVSVFCG